MTEENFSGEITLSSSDQQARIPMIPQPILEALFKSVTSAKEKFTIRRRRPKIISNDDLLQLQYQIQQWAEPLQPIGNSLLIVANRKSSDHVGGTDKTSYKDFKSLSEVEPARKDAISQLSIRFDFLLAGADAEKKADSFQCDITLFGDTRIYHMLAKGNDFIGFIPNSDLDDDDTSMRVEIRYSNYMVAKGLLHVIDEWYESLEDQVAINIGSFFKAVYSSHRFHMASMPPIVVGILVFLTCALASGTLPYVTRITGFFPVQSLTLSVGIFIVFLCTILTWFYRKIEGVQPPNKVPLLQLNRGDAARFQEYQDKIVSFRKNEANFKNFTIFGVGASIVGSVILNVVQVYF